MRSVGEVDWAVVGDATSESKCDLFSDFNLLGIHLGI